MWRSTWKFIFSAIPAVLLASPAFAQGEPDSTRSRFLPTGIRFGTDAISLVRSYTSPVFKGWEINADMDFGRFFLVADYGNWSSDYSLSNGVYESSGPYFRAGVDVNFMLKDPDGNLFLLGLRHGHSEYTDYAAYSFTDTNFGDIQSEVSNSGLSANWKELVTSLRVKVWKVIWMGYTARFKFALDVKGEGALKTFDVPGYGLSAPTSFWGFNYQIFIRVPLRERK